MSSWEAPAHDCEALQSTLSHGPLGKQGEGRGQVEEASEGTRGLKSEPSPKRVVGVHVCTCVTVSGRYVRNRGWLPLRGHLGGSNTGVRGKHISRSGSFCF